MFDHAIKRQAELAANIMSMYTNVNEVTKKVVGIEEFQKSYTDETHVILTQPQITKWVEDTLQKSAKIQDLNEKQELEKAATNDLNSFEKIHVVAENGNNSVLFVKKRDELIEKAAGPTGGNNMKDTIEQTDKAYKHLKEKNQNEFNKYPDHIKEAAMKRVEKDIPTARK